MGSVCAHCFGLNNDTGQGHEEFLSQTERDYITTTWKELTEGPEGLNVLVQEMANSKAPLMKLAFTATNSLMFGAMEHRLRRQIAQIGHFITTLIVNLELNELEVSLACEQFGSDDAENEIRDNTAQCSIREVSIFVGLLVSHLSRKHSNNRVLLDGWKKLGTFMIHSMKDGAFWAEERWGVHLPTHAD